MCVKPDWIDHQSAPIYSCDIHPSSSRLVTAGGDNTLRIWSLPPLLSAAAECQPLSAAPRLLASLPNHLNPVNCCRFSPNGALLASCSDGVNGSAAILLWRLAAEEEEFESSRPFGSEHDEDEDVEHWQLAAQLRGHTADILDLAFSPCSRYLASASVDNNVVLWDCQQYTAIAVLRGHAGWVKGVSWDPCGRYVASYGDDQCVMVWDGRDDWKCKKRITDTFVTAADKDGGKGIGRIGINEKMKQIVFARLSWSANGAYLAASRGYDGSKAIPVSPVFNRAGWKRTSVLVGHKHPTTVTRFNPRMFTRAAASVAAELTTSSAVNGSAVKRRSARSHLSTQSLDAEASQPPFYPTYTVCAVGSLDNSISVWVTSSPTPLVHLDSFFSEAIVDLAWSADGYTLLACSHDGTVAVFSFTEDEFGRALTADEMKAHMRHEYGGEEAAGAAGGLAVVESLVGLELDAMGREYEERKRKAVEDKEEGRMNGVARVSSTAKMTSEELKASQKEGTKVDSKGRVRRVVAPVHIESSTVYSSSLPPVLLIPPTNATVDGGVRPSTAAPASAPSPTLSLSAPVLSAASSSSPSSFITVAPSSTTSLSSSDPAVAKRRRDSDGVQVLTKKKKPTIAGTSSAVSTSPAATNSSVPSAVSSSVPPSASVPSSSAPSVSAAPTAQSQLPQRARYCVEPAPMHKHLLCRLPSSSDALFTTVSLSSPALEPSMIESVPPVSASRSALGSSARSFSTLVCRRAGAEQWQTVLPGHCTLLAANASIIVACCRDERDVDSTGILFFLSRSGRRLLPPLHLSAPASFVTVCTAAVTSSASSPSSSSSPSLSSAFVLLLTSDGQLRLFDAVQLECVLELDIRSLLLSSSFSAARVLSDGRLLLMVKDGTCWLYEKRLKGWLNLADSDYVASDFKSTLPLASLGGAVQDGADRSLSSLQTEAQRASSVGSAQVRAPLLTLDARSRSMHTVAHIEVAPRTDHTMYHCRLLRSLLLTEMISLLVVVMFCCVQAQLAASEQLGSTADYQRWLHVYVQTLVSLTQANDTLIDFTAANPVSSPLATLSLARLQELTTSLLPSLHSYQATNTDSLCGLDRCTTLRSLLPALASGRQTQRIAESVLQRVKEWEQRTADRDKQRPAETEQHSNETDMNGVERLPSLFASSVSARSTAEMNGFHSLSPSSSTSTRPASTSSITIGPSPSTPINGLLAGTHSNSSSSSNVNKHQQLQQRLMGGGVQQAHDVGFNGTTEDSNGNGTVQPVMID